MAYCRECGTFVHESDTICSQGHPNTSVETAAIVEAVRTASLATSEQGRLVANLIDGLASAQMLPAVELVRQWWEALGERQKKDFINELLGRIVYRVRTGSYDNNLDVSSLNAGQLIEETPGAREALAKRLAERMADKYDLPYNVRENTDLARVVAATFAERYVSEHAEELEALAKDFLPSPEELARVVADRVVAATEEEVKKALKDKRG
jgi:hypothetical protein